MKTLLSALLLATLPCTVMSQVTFALDLQGQGTYRPSTFPSCPPDNPYCDPVPFEWLGTVTIVTASAVDGTYAGGAGLSSIAVDTNYVDSFSPGFNRDNGATTSFPAYVTLLGGAVTGISYFDYSLVGATTRFRIDGMTATYFVTGGHHGTPIQAQGIVGLVPEPSTYALTLAGLLAVGIVRRRASNSRAI